MGEIYMIAVDPDFQRRGIAASLTSHAVEWFEDAGMSIAMVETGGDPGHALRTAYIRVLRISPSPGCEVLQGAVNAVRRCARQCKNAPMLSSSLAGSFGKRSPGWAMVAGEGATVHAHR